MRVCTTPNAFLQIPALFLIASLPVGLELLASRKARGAGGFPGRGRSPGRCDTRGSPLKGPSGTLCPSCFPTDPTSMPPRTAGLPPGPQDPPRPQGPPRLQLPPRDHGLPRHSGLLRTTGLVRTAASPGPQGPRRTAGHPQHRRLPYQDLKTPQNCRGAPSQGGAGVGEGLTASRSARPPGASGPRASMWTVGRELQGGPVGRADPARGGGS